MKVIEVSSKPESTSECVDLLSKHDLVPTTWKRTYKIKLSDNQVRVFKNTHGEFKTIVTDRFRDTKIFDDLDFTKVMPLVKEISKVAKYYYTHDGGGVYLNPYTKDLFISAGDGGYIYSTRPKADLQKEMDEKDLCLDEMDHHFVDFDKHKTLSELNSVEWEGEADPHTPEFIVICEINTLN